MAVLNAFWTGFYKFGEEHNDWSVTATGQENYFFRWGDGTSDVNNSSGSVSEIHTYAADGEYTVSVTERPDNGTDPARLKAHIFGTSTSDLTIDGGDPADLVKSGSGDDTIRTRGGADLIYSGDGADRVKTGDGADFVFGQGGNDTLNGEGGADFILGGDGNDTLVGGDGVDNVVGGNGQDTLTGDAGNDTVFGEAGDDVLRGGDGDDNVWGGAGNDNLNGDAGNDSIAGYEDDDRLKGGAGDDILQGNAGRDLLFGDAGFDSFRFLNLSDSVVGNQRDTIADFREAALGGETDRIDLRDLGLLTFIAGSHFSGGGAGQVRFSTFASATIVQIDKNGDALADSEIGLTGVHNLAQNDFRFA